MGELEAHVRLLHQVGTATLFQGIERGAPLLACFEFDYPSLNGLKTLRATKQAFPALPILMLTLHHSEALAVWAFRTRVWDYLVKPVSEQDLWRRIGQLLQVLPASQDAGRQIAMPAPLIPQEARIEAPGRSERVAEEALTYVQRHYAEVLRLEDVARCCRMSVWELSRSFKRVHGLTFREYLCRYRLQRALKMLGNPHVTICEVASAAGFRNASHFTRLFRQRIGVTPSQYRLNPSEHRPCPEDA
ncbi:response regulator transcription factor [Pseudomonas benzenivorans]|uniref:Helix-turn-helix domain-containing protein n=1 Tax=Pseudomonas benzenivorans TaxID=556533 RepID=A0ABY5H8A1_9PSED|nr:response regulator transcription factor [Pseudomonas benzenivorans]UTW08550.1 helix-turn-helix domain-containing protein [Pseudomonas benzenivorans]